jgi:alpha-L-fucosidase
MKRTSFCAVLTAAVLSVGVGNLLAADAPTTKPAKAPPPDAPETREHKDARMLWWREAKFGMFIHWGTYSVPAGTYDDKKVGGIGEWIMHNAKIPTDIYQKYPAQFTCSKFDAEQWMQMADDAGVKYVVITSKHHEGFAMFKTAVDKYNIVDATPFKRDPLAELAVAAKKHGIKLGFYYSQAQDWNHAGGAAAGGHWDKEHQDGSMADYVDKVAVPEVKEILSNYGHAPAVLWWDTPVGMTRPMADKLYKEVKELRPDIIMNNRLGGGYQGDTETPEQKIPAAMMGRDWESCMTMNDTWGYKSYDNHFKSDETLLFNLIDIASKGGNYLLNVGPTSEGEIPQPEVDRLLAMGKWLKTNGEAIYASGPSCFGEEYGTQVTEKDGYGRDTKVSGGKDWRCTTKPGKIYLEIFKWPGKQFSVPAGCPPIKAAYLLSDHKPLTVSDKNVSLPETAPDPICSVLTLEVEPK